MIELGPVLPLLDGAVPSCEPAGPDRWRLADGRTIACERALVGDVERLTLRLEGEGPAAMSLGLRFPEVAGVTSYMRNGYHSWDGAWFAAPGDPDAGEGHAFTALTGDRDNATILGFERHDRFQSRFRFIPANGALTIDAETLLDRTAASEGEALLHFSGPNVEGQIGRAHV